MSVHSLDARPASVGPLLFVLALAVYLVGATEFMLAPMLTPLADAYRTTSADAAWLVSSYACAYALAAPAIGLLSDRLDRRRVLLPALLVFALDGASLTIAPTFGIAIACRAIGGLAAAAIVPTTFALIADVLPPAARAGAMGRVLLGMTLGIATGPGIAGWLTAHAGWRAPFLVTAASCLLVFTIARRWIPARHPVHASDAPSARASLRALTRGPLVRPLVAKGLWLAAAVSGFLLSGELLRQHAALETAQVGAAVSLFGIGLGAGNALVGRIERRLPRRETTQLVLLALLVLAIAATYGLPAAWPASLVPALAGIALLGLTLGVAAPVSTALLATRAAGDAGLVLAVSESLNNLVLLALLPVAAQLLARATPSMVGLLLVSVELTACALLLTDARLVRRDAVRHPPAAAAP